MLPPYWRFAVYNDTGVALSNLEITFRRWKFGTDGAVSYEGTEQSQDGGISTTLADGTYDVETALKNNATDLYIGLHGRFRGVMPGSGTVAGNLTLYLEFNSANDVAELDYSSATVQRMAERSIPLVTINFTAISQDFCRPFEI